MDSYVGNGLWFLEEGVLKVGVSNLLQNLNIKISF